MSSEAALESRVESLCTLIVKTDPEIWDIRNKAVSEMISLMSPYDGCSKEQIQELFSPNVFKHLKEPIKMLIADLRSQQVKEICSLISRLSELTKDHMKGLLRDTFSFILDGVKVPNKTISGYVDVCILSIIKNVVYKPGIPLLAAEVKENKAKQVRERCLYYLNEVLIRWDVGEKDVDLMLDAIRCGLEDGCSRCREVARVAYLNLFAMYPKKAERIKSTLSNALKLRMNKHEMEFVLKVSQGGVPQGMHASQMQPPSPHKRKASGKDAALRAAASAALGSSMSATAYASASASASAAAAVNAHPRPAAFATEASMSSISMSSISSADTYDEAEKARGIKLGLRAPRPSCEDDAVTSIQAVIRGKLTRRQTLMNVIKEAEDADDADAEGNQRRATISPQSPVKSSTNMGTGITGTGTGTTTSNGNGNGVERSSPKSSSSTGISRMNSTQQPENASKLAATGAAASKNGLRGKSQETHLSLLLKMKIAHSMKILNYQLQLAEELEKSAKSESDQQHVNGAESTNSTSTGKKIRDLMAVVAEETMMCSEFQSKLQTLI